MKNSIAVTAFTALGQESRLNVFRLIVQRANKGVTPSEIIELLGIPGATLSFHLKELANSGLVSFERQSRSLIYKPEPKFINDLVAFLSENCCGGVPCGMPTKATLVAPPKGRKSRSVKA
jgi:ArsR family transcriptional regulator, arsenate/arsenite/antimonite-responsive transcriptional repressor